MNLAPTEEQQALVAAVTDLLATHSTPDLVRKAEQAGGFDRALWAQLAEFGLLAMALSEARGGWGASLLDLSLVAECLGGALAPVPAIESICAARLLDRVGSEPASTALAAVLAGELMITLAVRTARGGQASLVPAAAVADAAAVFDGERLVLVDIAESNRTAVANLAAASLADVRIDEAAVTVLATGDVAAAGYADAVDEWLVLTAAQLVGSAAVAHRMTCEYAAQRQTWGVPIGSYQGVSHPLADAATAIDGARLLARKAAWALSVNDPRGAELAAMSFAFAAEMARDATYLAVHLHGGVGFTLEHDAQLHYRRARGWARVWGEPRDAQLRVADRRYGSVA